MLVVVDRHADAIKCAFEGQLDDCVPQDIEMSLRSQLRQSLDLQLDFSRIES